MSDLKKIKTWYENLNKNTLDQIEIYYDRNVFFKDPFNEIFDRDGLRKVFYHMFENLENPHYVLK